MRPSPRRKSQRGPRWPAYLSLVAGSGASSHCAAFRQPSMGQIITKRRTKDARGSHAAFKLLFGLKFLIWRIGLAGQSRGEGRIVLLDRGGEISFHLVFGGIGPQFQIFHCLIKLAAENMLRSRGKHSTSHFFVFV